MIPAPRHLLSRGGRPPPRDVLIALIVPGDGEHRRQIAAAGSAGGELRAISLNWLMMPYVLF